MTPILDSISKSFGSRPILEGISLSLAAGGITCLLGPSGCGKSTLLRIAASLIPPEAGKVLVEPARAAMVFQDPRLLPWLTVAENLALALPGARTAERKTSIRQALDLVSLPMSGGDVRGLLPRELSGGMAQRVSLARALLRRPDFLLMDEPFAALDAITRGELQKMLVSLIAKQRVNCLFVTHDLNEALTIADHIKLLKDGKIQFSAPVPAAAEHDRIKQRILSYLQTDRGNT
ncbi:MAG: ABC transporter ATP-binding protein [Candidatus Adiutrix sp.]|jgi:ABC-type nitrate/sulfonate/bicarbonate transport system ATPase subunit|nr:ABC transporter ATP-binding protein [Candidatus Adiutrix sp.]